MTLEIRDGDGVEKHLDAVGVGSTADPFVPVQISHEWQDAVGSGLITGAERFDGFGEITLSGAKTGADVWDGPTETIPKATGGIQMQVVSDSASDTSAGIGVRSVNIHYIQADGTAATETVILNGTTPVNTVATDILFVNRFHTWTVGVGGGTYSPAAIGNITIESVGGATVYAKIAATGNQTLSTAKMVPSGKVLYINRFTGSEMANKKVTLRLRTESHEGVLTPGVFLFKASMNMKLNAFNMEIKPAIKVPAGAIVKVGAWGENASDVTASWNGWIENV